MMSFKSSMFSEWVISVAGSETHQLLRPSLSSVSSAQPLNRHGAGAVARAAIRERSGVEALPREELFPRSRQTEVTNLHERNTNYPTFCNLQK